MRRFFQTSYAAASWRKPRKVVARVEASEQGSDVRFIVTNLPGPAKVLYEKVYCARGRMENSHQGHEALHALRPHLLPPLGGQPVPPVPSHGGLLAPARTQGRPSHPNGMRCAARPRTPQGLSKLVYRAARQAHREHRALAQFACHRHIAAHHARELAREGKAEPGAAEAPVCPNPVGARL
jgi:Transposase DDE domain group 1